MKEKTLRQLHRATAVPLAIFIIIQSVTGLILTVEVMMNRYNDGPVHDLHYELGIPGGIYRLILGTGLIWMSATGILIYLKIRARTKKTAQP